MNAKKSGCVLSLVALAGFNSCAPMEESYARSNRSAGRASSAVSGKPSDSQAWPLNRKTMTELESEELRIRNNASLSPAERQQQLQRVWKDQRDLIAGRDPSPSGTVPPMSADKPASSAPQTSPEASTSQNPAPAADSSKPQPPTPTTPPPNTPPSKGEEPKYATKVPGKNGWIKSPYDGKVLDAAGVPPGTQVKDPDSGRIMIVP